MAGLFARFNRNLVIASSQDTRMLEYLSTMAANNLSVGSSSRIQRRAGAAASAGHVTLLQLPTDLHDSLFGDIGRSRNVVKLLVQTTGIAEQDPPLRTSPPTRRSECLTVGTDFRLWVLGMRLEG